MNNPIKLKKGGETRVQTWVCWELLLQTALFTPLQSCQYPNWNGYTVSWMMKTDPCSINFSFASFFLKPEKLPHSLYHMQLCYAQLQEQCRWRSKQKSLLQPALLGEKALQTTVSDLIPPVYLGKENVWRKGEMQWPFPLLHCIFHSPFKPAYTELILSASHPASNTVQCVTPIPNFWGKMKKV